MRRIGHTHARTGTRTYALMEETTELLTAAVFVMHAGGKYSGRWATGADYGRTAVQWAQAIKARFPAVQTLAIGCHSYAYAQSAPTYRGESRLVTLRQLVTPSPDSLLPTC